MKTVPYEIERKFLIRRPDPAELAAAEKSEITQTYLLAEPGCTARVRKQVRGDICTYTHTVKHKISDLRRIEEEREISEESYRQLLKRADPEKTPIRKTRYCLPYCGQLLEIDVFPFWKRQAYLEIELAEESEEIHIPPFLQIIREVTSDSRYTNAALAGQIPPEESEGNFT